MNNSAFESNENTENATENKVENAEIGTAGDDEEEVAQVPVEDTIDSSPSETSKHVPVTEQPVTDQTATETVTEQTVTEEPVTEQPLTTTTEEPTRTSSTSTTDLPIATKTKSPKAEFIYYKNIIVFLNHLFIKFKFKINTFINKIKQTTLKNV